MGATIVAASLLFSDLAFGQTSDLYQKVLADPSNVQLTIQYAEQARNRGDYEAAISAYERLLLYNPNLPNLKYELGQLYFELESYPAARSYFEAVIATPNVAPALQVGARNYIVEIDRRLSPTRFRGYLHAGLRYQTNANAGPASDQNIKLDNTVKARADWNSFGLMNFDFAQDLGTGGREDAFEANLSSYYAKQFEIGRVNLGAAELQAGPRLTLFPETIIGVSGKVYGIANGYTLGDDPYLRTFGAGTSVRWKVSPLLIMESAFEYRGRKYYNSDDYPSAADQSGDLYSFNFAAGGLLTGQSRWFVRTGYEWNNSGLDFWSYQRPFADVGLSSPVVIPWVYRAWLFTVYAGGSAQDYRRPDPSVDPATKRADHEWHVGMNVDAELTSALGLKINVAYQKNESNLTGFAYQNFAVSFGPTLRF
jgi:tetratricopeptide (TPR) repeat protein